MASPGQGRMSPSHGLLTGSAPRAPPLKTWILSAVLGVAAVALIVSSGVLEVRIPFPVPVTMLREGAAAITTVDSLFQRGWCFILILCFRPLTARASNRRCSIQLRMRKWHRSSASGIQTQMTHITWTSSRAMRRTRTTSSLTPCTYLNRCICSTFFLQKVGTNHRTFRERRMVQVWGHR